MVWEDYSIHMHVNADITVQGQSTHVQLIVPLDFPDFQIECIKWICAQICRFRHSNVYS